MHTFQALPQPFALSEVVLQGIDRRTISRAVRDGRLVRLGTGLYAESVVWSAAPPWKRHRNLALAARRLTPDAILSHESAALLRGLPHPRLWSGRVTMTVLDDGRTSPADDWRCFHRGTTPYDHLRLADGRAHFVDARIVVDCLRTLAPSDALAIVDAALRAGLVEAGEVREIRRHQRRWPGIAMADRILALADPRRESWLESASSWTLTDAGIPPGIPQVLVYDGDVLLGRADTVWPDLGIVGEADGAAKYSEGAAGVEEVAAALVRQNIRHSRIMEVGLQVVRWEADAVRDPSEVVRRFWQARDRAAGRAHTATLLCSCHLGPLTCCVTGTPRAA